MPGTDAVTLQRDGDTLRVGGALTTAAVAAAWPRALGLLEGVHRFDLGGVSRVDSAGVALLAELAQRAGGVAVSGDPAGLAALRAAYRLDPALAYVG
ncbi:STAS domain-containing protein [Cognatiluteimonas telluris]|jgi:phospholipid transport system transporter-binding protein|uniref:STAS domain-containing protein n=1 Tax=Cognatiluteimonas telluris TaxID=1104775 RepID=UPI00140AC077|nr:STAS domain-containing protein [Lysobacter telluris]